MSPKRFFVNPLRSFRSGTIRRHEKRGGKAVFMFYPLKIQHFQLFSRFLGPGWLVNRTGAIVLDFKIG